MKRRNKKEKSKIKKTDNSINLNISEEHQENEFSILNENNESSIIIEEQNNVNKNKKEPDEITDDGENNDIFENALILMDEESKNGKSFTSTYEPTFSINYPDNRFNTIPIFTPSTRLNSALQIEDKNECFTFYYTHKKTLYPTIYNQLIGISGNNAIFVKDDLSERDFIWANLTSIIFTNQKNFINLKVLVNEYINPLMKKYKKSNEEKKIFMEQLFNNIIIQEYFSYDELLMKINELNIFFKEHKFNNVGLIIIDGINSITPHKLEIHDKANKRGYTLKFYKYNMQKFAQYSNKKNNRFSNDNKINIRRPSKWENCEDIKDNIYGKNSNYKEKYDNEKLQQHIVDLIMNYQEKFNFNLILTVFDFSQANFYIASFSGKVSYKENKNTYCVNCPQLQKENCYFSFKLPKIQFPKKTMFLEPINLCLNYNNDIFGLITNSINSNNINKLIFQVFKKSKDDYRPTRIVEKIEFDYQ